MGRCFNFYVTEETEREKAVAQFEARADRSRCESGHSDSSEIGMKTEIADGPADFADVKAAYEWVQENNNKWGPAHLVRLIDGRYCYGGWCSS